MKSIKSKFIAFTLAAILLCTALIGGIAIRNMSQLSDSDSADIINLLVREASADINGTLGRIEQSVDVLAGSANDYIDLHSAAATPQFLDELSTYIDPLLLNAAHVTDSCIGVYIRYSTDITAPDAGIFYTNAKGNGALEPFPCTDISLFAEDDIEHVGWYYIPRNAGKPTWMLPYYNGNIDVYMISYIVPLYIQGTFIGILGMDIDFNMLTESVAKVTAYREGYAYLTDDDFNIIYHPDLPLGTTPEHEHIVFHEVYNEYVFDDYNGNLFHYDYNGEQKVYAYRKLLNGLNLCLTVPLSDINRNLHNTVTYIIVATVIIALITIAVTIVICGTITKPLQKLTSAAIEIAKGELDINIDVHTSDEVGVLADTLQKTTSDLSKYVQKINRLAYIDSLTGVDNKTSYDVTVAMLEENIANHTAQFAVAVLDVNDLKKTNDTLGHYYGDMLITNAAKLIETSFLGCPVYRIGGDEFVVIMDGMNYQNRDALRMNFAAAIASERKRGGADSVSIACGTAEFTEGDTCYSDVFTRADSAMYENKKQMKS